MPAKLIIQSKHEQASREVPFDKSRMTIGRKAGNDLQFNRPEISGTHAAFVYENDEYFIEDLGSTNGTLLNGAKLVPRQRYSLQHQDVISIAPYGFVFVKEQDISDTLREEASTRGERAGSGTILDIAAKISTGTEEHKKELAAGLDSTSPPPSAPAPAAAPAAKAAEPATPKPAAPATPPAPAPVAVTPSADASPAAQAASVPAPAPPATSSIGIYVWLGIGGLIVLAAILVIVLILFL